ncbi:MULTISPECIES: DUF1850 domain-containing protein [Allobacillus]|uniref:DUF1850 domain-containing protein n=1 Tax=Allobacillus saliphilus TaxID=2912308 RepID=A0A941CX75_9BACI|nr:DUF1850 domain-containing protein [Allobacillus saliphilus]MBR7553890.1 DUF1850 domain-containing protein [Allobacillus saliphilus]MBR7554834.1 DUF1850 domain-containing protein [Allobacillus saliphilus]
MSSNSLDRATNRKALLSSNAFLKKIKWLILIILLFIIFLAVILFSQSTYLLQIEKVENSEILWEAEIEENEWFAHEYIHSVEKSPVIEKFKYDSSGKILTMESWTKSFGAGMPYERKGKVEMVDGYFVIKDLNKPIHDNKLLMQPSDLFPHKFYFKDQEIILSEEPFIKNVIEIKVSELTGFERITNLFN